MSSTSSSNSAGSDLEYMLESFSNQPKLTSVEKMLEIIVLCETCTKTLKHIMSVENKEPISFCEYCLLKKHYYPTFEFSTAPVHRLKNVNQ